MSKKICKSKKNGEEIKVKYPKYQCKVCDEMAVKEKHLCKPVKR